MNISKKIVINLIQDVATPHNNVLIKQFLERDNVEIKLWYAVSKNERLYQWSQDITHEHLPAVIYGQNLNLSFLSYCLTHSHERFVIVGWMNINTRLIHLLFFFLRRSFNHWTDLSSPTEEGRTLKQKILRRIAYLFLRYSNSKIFGVGKMTLDCFRVWGFPEHRLVNLPIFVNVDEDIHLYRSRRSELHQQFNVPEHGFLLSAGSRLIYEKGYDLLIESISKLTLELREKIKLVIVGSGEELPVLKQQVKSLQLDTQVQFHNWMNISDFKFLIANSDIFFHPARFDAYGGTTLGMALEVVVIGSTGAGAAVDRIEHGINGFLYEPSDTKTLSDHIEKLLNDESARKRIAFAGRVTALKWTPTRGVDILVEHSV